jgi:hypothetical protein
MLLNVNENEENKTVNEGILTVEKLFSNQHKKMLNRKNNL